MVAKMFRISRQTFVVVLKDGSVWSYYKKLGPKEVKRQSKGAKG
jgi:hypothetical protein